MNCLTCSGQMEPYFTKDFAGRLGLKVVDYWKCEICGMVVSKTHFEMSLKEWEDVNVGFHSSFHGTDECEEDPRWIERLIAQSNTISELTKIGILPEPSDELPWVDYACGDGKLVDALAKKGLKGFKYEAYYAKGDGYLSEQALKEKKYGLVINTSVLEYIRELEQIDGIVNLISDSGVFALHTLVCETIPKDPSWFYLLPVHCTFFTNKSMQILFDRWGFKASIYNVESRMWFFLKDNIDSIESIFEKEKHKLSGEFHFKRGFVDYWK